jgi:hypothetical protein
MMAENLSNALNRIMSIMRRVSETFMSLAGMTKTLMNNLTVAAATKNTGHGLHS